MGKTAKEKIHFHFLYKPFYFRNRSLLKTFLLKQFKKEGKTVEVINYIFCSDAYLLKINTQYLNHDSFTDIITFELSPKTTPFVADIYISVDRIKENAYQFQVSFSQELHRVIFHGALHLVGYKDKSKEQARVMRKMEESWLNQYFDVPREKRI